MKQFRSWLWEENGRTTFYALDLRERKLAQTWGKAGIMNGTRFLELDYPTREEAWATFEALRLQAEERAGRIPAYPAAKKLFEDAPKQLQRKSYTGDLTKPRTDPEDAALELIRHKRNNQVAREFQQDLETYRRIYNEPPPEDYYRKLMGFYVFLEKRRQGE